MVQTALLIALSEITKQRRWLIDLLGVSLQTLCSAWVPQWGCPCFSASSCSSWSTRSASLSPDLEGKSQTSRSGSWPKLTYPILTLSCPTPPHCTKPPQRQNALTQKFPWPQNLGWSGVLGKEVIVEKGQDSQYRLSLGSLGIPQAEKRRPPSAEQGQALGK